MSVMMITLSGCQASVKTGGFTSYDEHYQKNETALKEDALSDRWESRGSKVAVVSKEKADNNDYPEAKEVLLVNNTKNKVIVSQKVFDQAYPASTTKIMTALLTLENLNLSQVVTIKHDITFPDGAAVAIHLKKGDKITVEALLNALAHRDYQNQGSVYVKHYPDKVVIENPGGFPEGITQNNIITHPSVSRNKLIAETLQRLKYVQRTGQGVDIIYRDMVSSGKPYPEYRSYSDAVSLTMYSGIDDIEFVKFIAEEQNSRQWNSSLAELMILRFLTDQKQESYYKEQKI